MGCRQILARAGFHVLVVLVLSLSCLVSLLPDDVLATPLVSAGRVARGDSVMVVSAHPQATEAGLEILRAGGNAVDAAVAVALALAVVEPYSSGLGGGGFALSFTARDGRVRALDFRETAPAAARRDMFLVDGKASADLSCYGALAVATPALARGLAELHRAGGRLPWPHLAAPAIALARDGFPVTPLLCERIAEGDSIFNAAARAVFLPRGRILAVGDTLRQPDLALTLEALARDGGEALNEGPLAAGLVRTVQQEGGLLTEEDLTAVRPIWREPVRGTYQGFEVWSMPPPSSGGVHLIQMLNILAGFPLQNPFTACGGDANPADLVYGRDDVVHLLIEAMKFAYADRSRYLGDPDFVSVPVRRLISRAYADSLRERIDPDVALPWDALEGAPVVLPESDETSHLSVVDGAGDAVAMTLTVNLHFGSGLLAAGTGVILNDEMDDFVAAPGVPNAFGLVGDEANAIAPGKRPLSSMTPAILLREGRVFLVSGSPGGSRIITTVLQTVLNVVDFGLDAGGAVTAPRIHHQWYPPEIFYEPFGLTRRCARLLAARGHVLKLREVLGNAQLIVVDPTTGRREGASDPRGEGAAGGY
jgi:gamma-glutamyltranspeptidase/glutathione hydrolase